MRKNGKTQKVKVLEVSKTEIKFVRHLTSTPVYTLPIGDIAYIEYSDGEKEVFDDGEKETSKSQAEAKTEVGPTKFVGRTSSVAVPAAASAAVPQKNENNGELQKWHGSVKTSVPVEKAQEGELKKWHGSVKTSVPVEKFVEPVSYKVGSIYEANGEKGIVVSVSDGGQHGIAVSLKEADLQWSSLEKKALKMVGAKNEMDGGENMKILEKYIADNNLSWDDFPAFAWCRSLGPGWYLPSVNELWSFGTLFNGGSRKSMKRSIRTWYNKIVADNGGVKFNAVMMYCSSTEDDAKDAKFATLGIQEPYYGSESKRSKLYVRAFIKF